MILWLILAYFSGSIPYGKLFCLLGGVDIQKRGSGNIGYANVLRIMGWRTAKGFVPTYCAYQLLGPAAAFWVGIAAILGHIFPLWLRFRGGKGIATGLGVLLVFAPLPALIGTVLYFGLTAARNHSSLASIMSALVAIGGFIILEPSFWWMGVILVVMAVYTLRQNFFGKVPNYG